LLVIAEPGPWTNGLPGLRDLPPVVVVAGP
jgi:hypothetical protein